MLRHFHSDCSLAALTAFIRHILLFIVLLRLAVATVPTPSSMVLLKCCYRLFAPRHAYNDNEYMKEKEEIVYAQHLREAQIPWPFSISNTLMQTEFYTRCIYCVSCMLPFCRCLFIFFTLTLPSLLRAHCNFISHASSFSILFVSMHKHFACALPSFCSSLFRLRSTATCLFSITIQNELHCYRMSYMYNIGVHMCCCDAYSHIYNIYSELTVAIRNRRRFAWHDGCIVDDLDRCKCKCIIWFINTDFYTFYIILSWFRYLSHSDEKMKGAKSERWNWTRQGHSTASFRTWLLWNGLKWARIRIKYTVDNARCIYACWSVHSYPCFPLLNHSASFTGQMALNAGRFVSVAVEKSQPRAISSIVLVLGWHVDHCSSTHWMDDCIAPDNCIFTKNYESKMFAFYLWATLTHAHSA